MQHLVPYQMRRILEEAPIAYVPVGTIEWHGEHLPLGVDSLVAYALLSRAAAATGGAVSPPSSVSCGLLKFPYSFDYGQRLLDKIVRKTLNQLCEDGFRFIVVMTRHGPMDQIHTIKSACEDLMAKHPAIQAWALCWFELLVDTDEESIIDHAAKVETSLMQELWHDLVDISRLSNDPEEYPVGVYGRNPRFTASPDWGRRMVDHIVRRLSIGVSSLLSGSRVDNYSDLRAFIRKHWSKPLQVKGPYRSNRKRTEFEVFNDSAYSRFISSVVRIEIDGKPVPLEAVSFKNTNPGEEGQWQQAARLSPTRGFYIRRQQCGTIRLDGVTLSGNSHSLSINLQFAGVVDSMIEGTLMPATQAP
jgi:creatinine amidohydrolase